MPLTRQNYILTQGPLQTTADDFWQMVYEQNTQVVIMLSKVVEKNYIKCHSYFPSKEEPKTRLDLFECEWLGEEVKQHYICRQIRLSPLKSSSTLSTAGTALQDSSTPDQTINKPENAYNQGKSRIIQHLQFVTWPDFGVPQHTDHFLEFLEHVRRINRTNSSAQIVTSQNHILESREDKSPATDDNVQPPIVCHCSAGIGRTGTYVIVDTILTILEQRRNGNIDGQELPTPTTTVNLVENEIESAPNNISEPEDHQKLAETQVENESNKEATLKEPEDSETKSKRKKIKQKGEPTAELKHAPRELEPLDDIVSDMVVFIRKHRMGLIQTPSQLRFCWKAIVDWIKKEEQREAQESLFLETEKKKSRNSEPTSSSSIVDTKNNSNTSLEKGEGQADEATT
uniref:Uncharacterized protein n=1 Tax=Ditylenchus dipsaci TaxID=166011 RepID=A0A915D782_9BILA